MHSDQTCEHGTREWAADVILYAICGEIVNQDVDGLRTSPTGVTEL